MRVDYHLWYGAICLLLLCIVCFIYTQRRFGVIFRWKGRRYNLTIVSAAISLTRAFILVLGGSGSPRRLEGACHGAARLLVMAMQVRGVLFQRFESRFVERLLKSLFVAFCRRLARHGQSVLEFLLLARRAVHVVFFQGQALCTAYHLFFCPRRILRSRLHFCLADGGSLGSIQSSVVRTSWILRRYRLCLLRWYILAGNPALGDTRSALLLHTSSHIGLRLGRFPILTLSLTHTHIACWNSRLRTYPSLRASLLLHLLAILCCKRIDLWLWCLPSHATAAIH